MAAHRVCVAICFWYLYFFVGSSKSQTPTVDDSFITKHVLESDMDVGDIPVRVILEKFMRVQEMAGFINKKKSKNKRTIHTFIVTPDLVETKKDLINAYMMSGKTYYSENTFALTNRIQLTELSDLAKHVGAINFNIKFNKTELKYAVLETTCEYSYSGYFVLGATINEIEMKINHLHVLRLANPKECNLPTSRLFLSLPPDTCREKKKEKKRSKSTP